MLVNERFVRNEKFSVGRSASLVVGPFDIDITLDDAQNQCRAERSRVVAVRPSKSLHAKPRRPDHAPVDVSVRRRIHRQLLEHLDLANLDKKNIDAERMRPQVAEALERIISELDLRFSENRARERLIADLCDEVLGLGPLEKLLADDEVSEIMVVDPSTIFYEKAGKIERSSLQFTDDDSVRAIIERIITPLGRRIDESTPLVDARLKDGSRVNAIISPLAIRGACITIRKFAKKTLLLDDLIRFGSLTESMSRFLERSVKVRKNIVISGGTGSGKTTLLNVLSSTIPEDERIVTIEDSAELRLNQSHVVSLESRPPNMEGKGAYSIRDLVRNSLRMRPDRIVVGECRGGEALDMLQAMNTGHEGSMTTTHANSPREALNRLETLCLMAGLDLPSRAVRQQIASSVHLIVQQTRFSDGSRRITSIAEVGEINAEGAIELREIFAFNRTGTDAQGRIQGVFRSTGVMPSFLDEFITHGLVNDGVYL
ncbi:MAG: CpaF family protein [Deltaproteobacteria bacterium]|nr:CpaF family protein [Deltaproteobacteria bacterium]